MRPALLQGAVKGIGRSQSFEVTGQKVGRSTARRSSRPSSCVAYSLDRLSGSLGQVEAVGHRVVHGGEQLREVHNDY